MTAAKKKTYLVVGDDGQWSAGPFEVSTPEEAFARAYDGEALEQGDCADVYEIVGEVAKLTTAIEIIPRTD